MIRKYSIIVWGLFFLSGSCMAQTVSMPLTVDYPLLRALTVYQAFTEPDETATILDEKDGCNRVIISRPVFAAHNSLVRFETRVHIRMGQPLGENCLMPVEWEGYLVFHQQPVIDPASWTLTFKTLDSTVYDLNRQPAELAQTLFNIIGTDVHAYLNSIRIALAPPVSELKSVFSQFFQPAIKDRSMKMLHSIRPGKAHVKPRALSIDILMDVERHGLPAKAEKREAIDDEKLARLTDQWEAWDAFMVRMLCVLAPEPLSSEERRILLDTLLDTRYRFTAGLASKNLATDFVREQFVAAWKNLAPIFRKHLTDRPSAALMGYLAFFTASDALGALDEIGPALGIEISRNGLVRLARLLTTPENEDRPDVLTYRNDVNLQLRDSLGMGPPPEALGPAFDARTLDLTDRHESQVDIKSVMDAIGLFFCKPAWAMQKQSAGSLAEIKTWLVSKKNVKTHIDRTQSLLMDSARITLKKRQHADVDNDFFRLVVLSTAWQESCFRQFLVKREKIVYLRSYNGSSVGLMQINERVWRGLYDPQHLRWDIRYNALAGCEILDLYVTKYLLKHRKNIKSRQQMNDEARAGVIYAMYNGGPGQLDKFLRRSANGKLYDSDRLFLQKYVWVKNGRLMNIDKCLIGE